MLACERPWPRVQPWPQPCRKGLWRGRPMVSPRPGWLARYHCGAKPKLQLRSQITRSEAKAQLLKYLGCFNRGSGNAADVRTLISELERLPAKRESSLAGNWTLIGDTASSRPPLLMSSFKDDWVLRSVSMKILEDFSVQGEAVLGVSGSTKQESFQNRLQMDVPENPRKVSLGDVQMTIMYLDDDILILRDDGDPLVFLEGRVQNFYVKREVYLRSSPAPKLRYWRSYLDWRETVPQVPLWLLSWLRSYGFSFASQKRWNYGQFNFLPKTIDRIGVDFEPDLLQPTICVCQLGDLNDVGLIWSLFQYVLFEYEPGAGAASVEMRASMYTNMLYSGIFWTASFVAARAVLRAMKRRRGGLHVVELACGTALPSIAALAKGAKVTSTDISQLSLRLAEKSVELNQESKDMKNFKSGEMNSNFSTQIFDIMKEAPQKLLDLRPDLVVASDLLYSEEVAEALGLQLGVAAANGVTVITTDAGRLEGQGKKIFLENFRKACGPASVESSFVTEEIPDHILDLGVNAMKYGGQVDRAVEVFEFPPPSAKKRGGPFQQKQRQF